MRVNFFVVGAGLVAFAAGIYRSLGSTTGAVLIGIAGVALVLAGVFAPDPVRGFPPGASDRTARPVTAAAKLHDLTGPLMTFSLSGGCVAVATRLDGAWAAYTVATAVVGLGLTVWLVTAYRRNAANTGLVQRLLIATYWTWVAVLGTALA